MSKLEKFLARYEIWGFWSEKGEVTSKGRSEALIVDKTRTVLGFGAEPIGYFDAPALTPKEHAVSTFLRNGDTVFFEGTTLQTLGDFRNAKDGIRGFSGPGVAVDWFKYPDFDRYLRDLMLAESRKFDGASRPHRASLGDATNRLRHGRGSGFCG